MKVMFTALLALFFLCAAASARALTNERVSDLPVGNMKIKVIRDADVTMEKRLVPDLDKHPEYEGLFQRGPVDAVDQVFYFQDGPRKVLIDTGWGSEGRVKGAALDTLKEIGVRPEEITDILMTHLDMDHIGGLIQNGKKAFPNAKLWISKPEYDAWKNGSVTSRPKAAMELAAKTLKAYKNQVKTFDYGAEIMPGVTALDMSGHTPGHSGYQIKAGGDELIVAGDLIHIAPLQFPLPELSTVYDMDMQKAAETRARVLESAAGSGARIAGMHFPQISKVKKREDHGFAVMMAR